MSWYWLPSIFTVKGVLIWTFFLYVSKHFCGCKKRNKIDVIYWRNVLWLLQTWSKIAYSLEKTVQKFVINCLQTYSHLIMIVSLFFYFCEIKCESKYGIIEKQLIIGQSINQVMDIIHHPSCHIVNRTVCSCFSIITASSILGTPMR